MFKSAKNTGKGYQIPFKKPLVYKLKVKCPYGIDVENAWKWSAKFLIDMDDDEHYSFVADMQVVEAEIEKYLKSQFPTTYNKLFVMQTFLPVEKENEEETSSCFFRAKIPVKQGMSTTFFTGNGLKETRRRLTEDDLNRNSLVNIEVECDGWWIVDNSVGYTFVIKEIILC